MPFSTGVDAIEETLAAAATRQGEPLRPRGRASVEITVVEPFTRVPGHSERLALRTCEAFARLGNNVTLVTYGGLSQDSQKSCSGFTVIRAAPNGVTEFDWRASGSKIRTGSLGSLLRRQLQEFRTFRCAARAARRKKLSIVHFYDADPTLLLLLLSLSAPGRRNPVHPVLVLTVHDLVRLMPSGTAKQRVYYRAYTGCLRRLIERKLDGIVVLDPALKEGLIERLRLNADAAQRIRVLPHGIGDPLELADKEQARRRLGLKPDETIFLAFGILRNDKRIDIAIEAMNGLRECRLVIAGGPHDYTEDAVRELIRRHGCADSVIGEIGYVSEEKMHDFFSACDAAIIPYARRFKGLSGILTLACGHGRPVIASDVSLLGETVRQHGLGFAVEPENTEALRGAILEFLSLSPEARSEMARRVRDYAASMSWDSVCQEWVEFYQGLRQRRERLAEPGSS